VKHTAQKLAQEIRARLAEILRERVGDPRLEGISLVEVRVAPDASFARVFWATLGDAAAAAAALEKAKPYIRRCLAGELDVRRVPELDFRLDDTPARAQRVEDVLRDLSRERAAKTEEEPG
jgi:ribosome-binding factor A